MSFIFNLSFRIYLNLRLISTQEQGGIKHFALWEPHLLGQDSVIYGLVGAFCQKRKFPTKEEYFMQQLIQSRLKKYFTATEHYFLSCKRALLGPTWIRLALLGHSSISISRYLNVPPMCKIYHLSSNLYAPKLILNSFQTHFNLTSISIGARHLITTVVHNTPYYYITLVVRCLGWEKLPNLTPKIENGAKKSTCHFFRSIF